MSVCPVRLKIGVQTKILEALSNGTPVVTTTAGNSGIGGVSGKHLWVEDGASGFAERICSLLRGEEWDILSREGRRFVSEQYSWQQSVVALEQQLGRMIAIEP